MGYKPNTILLLCLDRGREKALGISCLPVRINPVSSKLKSLHSLQSGETGVTGGGGKGSSKGLAPSPSLPHRQYVLCTLPHITTFDFSGVTKADRTTAEVWKRMNIKPKKVRIKHNAL